VTTIDSVPDGGRILVTGAGGTIGSAVTTRLLEAGYPVTAFDVSFPHGSSADRVITGDATSATEIAGAFTDAVGVVHLAAIPGLGGDDPYPLFRLNVSATYNVLQTAADQGVRRAVIASSIQAIGIPNGHHDTRPDYYPMDEDTPPDVADAYSLSKQVDEHTAAAFARSHDMVVVAFRFPYTATAEHLADAARGAAEHTERGVGEGWSYLDVRDAAEAARLALATPLPAAAHVIALSAPDNLPGIEATELLRRHAPHSEVRGDVHGTATLYSSARAAELLGWHARHVRAWEHEVGA
jgi:nucleoside-diphosphate-sugar epimerase